MAALPVPCALLLWTPLRWQFLALGLFTIIGLLDIVDGIMARKQGPTQFGAMLDPLADKVFVVCAIIAFAAQGRAPLWIPALLLAREFLVTGLRTATALRQAHIKTSVLAKLKTSVQMAGFGLVFLNVAVPRKYAPLVLGSLAAAAVLVFIGRWIQQRARPLVFFWVPCGLIVLAFLVRLFVVRRDTTLTYLLIILVFTWGSGVDYLIGSARVLLRDGLKWVDFARIYWTAALVLTTVVAAADTRMAFLVIIAIAAELLVGGVDNLRALSGSPTPTWLYLVRSSVTTLLAGGLIAGRDLDLPDSLRWIAVAALTALSVGYAINDLVRARALVDGRAANAAYSTDPPPRTASA